jgi:hypothetical protein
MKKMKVSYGSLFDEGRTEANAEFVEDALASYGQPTLEVDGQPIDQRSWELLDYSVIDATVEELRTLNDWLWIIRAQFKE